MVHYNILNFGLKEATECTAILRKTGRDCRTMEETADRIVNCFYDNFADEKTGEKTFALVRLFKTHNYGDLDAELQNFAVNLLPHETILEKTRCLTLLATAGDDPSWKSRKDSKGHKAIPLPSEEVVNKIPMIRNLIKQLGIDVKTVIQPDPELIQNLLEKTFNVFLVPEAGGSSYIPAQENFVIPFNIKSVLGFGSLLPDGNIFAIIVFSKRTISEEVAGQFKTLALAIKISLLPFINKVFRNE